MPCYDVRDDCTIDPNTGMYIRKEKAIDILQSELNNRTRMLCSVLRYLEEKEFIIEHLPEEVNTWWESHKKFDQQRKEQK